MTTHPTGETIMMTAPEVATLTPAPTRVLPSPPLTDSGGRQRPALNWVNVAFLGSVHLLAVAAVVYLFAVPISGWTVALAVVWYLLCGLSVTGGYHRLFSHATYKAHPALRAFYLIFGAASFQNSVLAWCADHRAHHADTDGAADPYSVTDGFWWAHVGWVLHEGNTKMDRVRDLGADPLVRLQHRFCLPLGVVVGFLVPGALGFLWGDPLGAILVAGFLRLTLQWHATFTVNSVAHIFGRQTYSLKESARDNAATALVTLGEGYHNFHHKFQGDYRCGFRWYQIDPTKWFIWTLSRLGLCHGLRTVPVRVVEQARKAVALEQRKRREAQGA
jgi:stearoyl-CoA desaturase (delta-9 desaturase)